MVLLSVVMAAGCTAAKAEKEDTPVESKMIERFVLPSVIRVEEGADYELSGKGFLNGDLIEFTGEGSSVTAVVFNALYSSCEIKIDKSFISGISYKVTLKRDKEWQTLGITSFDILEPQLKYNICGKVSCSGDPLRGVWVSDGTLWAKTDKNGRYEILSQKARPYVFIVTPSGYFPECDGAWPEFWQPLASQSYNDVETHDFNLRQVDDTRHKMVVSADWQLRGENTPPDYEQAMDFFNEIKEYKQSQNVPVYSITLGDETWDVCWALHDFGLQAFRAYAREFPVPVFTVIGNHDHNPEAKDDFTAADKYRRILGPTNYAMNIGGIHYVVIDNVLYGTNPVSTTERMTQSQIDFLREDLSHVDKTTPVVLCAHVPMHNWSLSGSKWTITSRGQNYTEALNLLSDFENVHIFTGHSHYNEFYRSGNIREHKVVALGGCMWYTKEMTGYNISRDGIPSGYDILEADSDNLTWRFKAVGKDKRYQMRVYDLESVRKFFTENGKMANLVSNNPDYSFDRLYGSIPAGSVLINVFRGDPLQSNMKLEASDENGILAVTPAFIRDPLVVYASEACYWSAKKKLTASSYQSIELTHMYYVKPHSGCTNIHLKLSDADCGTQTYTEDIKLPLEFNIDND